MQPLLLTLLDLCLQIRMRLQHCSHSAESVPVISVTENLGIQLYAQVLARNQDWLNRLFELVALAEKRPSQFWLRTTQESQQEILKHIFKCSNILAALSQRGRLQAWRYHGPTRCNLGDEIMKLVLHCKFKQTRCCKQLRRKQRLFQRLHQPLQKDIAFVIRGARTPRKVLWRKSSRSLTVEEKNYVRMPPGPSLLRRKNMWEGHRVPCHYERRPPGPIMLTTINMREKFVFISLKRNRMKEGLQVPYCWVKWNLSTGWQMNPCNINKPHASLIWVHILV